MQDLHQIICSIMADEKYSEQFDDNGNETESASKRFKANNCEEVTENKIEIRVQNTSKAQKCVICKQYEDQVILYNGHPTDSVPEYIALTDDDLIAAGDEDAMDKQDERPSHKVILIQ